jgi:uncharacterized protein
VFPETRGSKDDAIESDEVPYPKPFPVPTKEDAPFWEALVKGRFTLPRCGECGHVWFPPYLNCQRCLSLDRGWFEASGRGEVVGVTIIEQPYLSSFEGDLPYNVCLIQLEEGPLLYSNVQGENESITVGLEVGVVLDLVAPGKVLFRFAPRVRK